MHADRKCYDCYCTEKHDGGKRDATPVGHTQAFDRVRHAAILKMIADPQIDEKDLKTQKKLMV